MRMEFTNERWNSALSDHRNKETDKLRAELSALIEEVKPVPKEKLHAALLRWTVVAKPLGGLGILEDDVAKIEAVSGGIFPRALMVFCADNGVVAEGISQTGQEVTTAVACNIAAGRSCSSLMAESCHTDLFAADMGIASEERICGTVHLFADRRIACGTRNFLKEEAMTENECLTALLTGADAARVLAGSGYRLLMAGEMGIGNTTTSAAVISALTGLPAEKTAGRGAGLSTEGLIRKTEVIREALLLHQLTSDRIPKENEEAGRAYALHALRAVGGFDIAAMAGFYLGCAASGVPVILDGLISMAAALTAVRIAASAGEYMLASHVSAEPAAITVLNELSLKAAITAGMKLGEGTGALALVPLLSMTYAVYKNMDTFEDMAIDAYQPLK